MAKLTKRQKALQAAVQPGKSYGIDDALKIVKDHSSAKFAEAVDVAVRLGVDARKSDQQVRGSTVLPAGTGKSVRVAVFARGPWAHLFGGVIEQNVIFHVMHHAVTAE